MNLFLNSELGELKEHSELAGEEIEEAKEKVMLPNFIMMI